MTVAEAEQFLISGRVQGVGYRAFVRREAEALGLSGQVRNLADGRVEVLAAGPRAARDALVQSLARGPLLARVDALQRYPCAELPVGAFRIG